MKSWLKIPLDWRLPNKSNPYELYWCDSCRFGQVFPKPTPEEVTKFYEVENYYTHSSVKTSNLDDRKTFMTRIQLHLAWRADRSVNINHEWITKYFGSNSSRVCEVGCGSGMFLEKLSSLGHKVMGVEPDPAAREVARGRGLQVFEGTAESLPQEIKTEPFDVVIMKHVLEHCVEPVKAVQEVFSLIKPGGMLVVETPNNAARGLNHSGITWNFLDVPRHLNFFTKDSLQSICKKADLHIHGIEFTGYTRQFSDKWIEIQQRIWQEFSVVSHQGTKLSKPNSRFRSWGLLLSTIFANPEVKYDSVRVIAIRHQ